MKREDDDLIELGAVTEETKGGPIGFVDAEQTKQPHPGLSAD